jgi:gluconolactonase
MREPSLVLGGVALRVLADGLDRPEGVALAADGSLWAGGVGGQVYSVALAADEALGAAGVAGVAGVAEGAVVQRGATGGTLLGVCVDGSGLVYCCDIGRREVLRLDPSSGDVSVYSAGLPSLPMVHPNWAVFDSGGNLYLTDSGHWEQDDGWIWKIAPGGVASVWSTESSNYPNGCCMAADERSLLVLESLTPALVRIPINDDGSAGPRTVVCELPGTVPDGVLLDAAGYAYVCCYEPNRILRVSPSGDDVEMLVDDPDGRMLVNPTNGVWFGPGLRRFACANLGGSHLVEVSLDLRGAAGLPLRYPRLR